MKALIIGNMGYVGPVLVRHLRARHPDWTLLGYDAAWFADCLVAPGWPERLLDAQHFGDARELPAELVDGVDAVVHLAAVSNDPMGQAFAQPTDAINRGSVLHAAHLAARAGVRHFVFASSCSVYGAAADGAPRREGDSLDPLTAYARSKVAAEQALAALDTDMTITCLRFATACGMAPRLRLDLVLNDFVASALATGTIAVLSDGTPWRPLIHVEDMARAIEWAMTRDAGCGGRVLVVNAGADDWNLRIADLAQAVARELPGTRVSINTEASPDRRSYRVDFSRFAQLAPNHRPQVTLAQAVHGLVEGLRAAGFDDADFRNSRLARLNVLRAHLAEGRMDPDLRWRPDAL